MYSYVSGVCTTSNCPQSDKIPDYLITRGGPYCDSPVDSSIVCPHCGMTVKLCARPRGNNELTIKRYNEKLESYATDILDFIK